jgi:hypothetical protein
MKPAISGRSKGKTFFALRSSRRYGTRSRNKYADAHQGPQEQDRRRRQIEAGQLKQENGLA